jgi:hypothetical protein
MTNARLTYRSGTGAAHLGAAAGMFFRRGPLLSPEGDGGGAGGAGGTTTTTEDKGAGSGAGGTTAADPKFTQSDVDKIVQDRLAKDRASRSQQTTTTTTKAPAADEGGEKLSLKELKAQMDAQEARRSFDRRVDKLGIAEDLANDLFALSQLQKPEDLGAWLEQKSKLYGSGATKGSETAGTQKQINGTTTETTAKIAAAAPGGAPVKVDTPTAGGLVDIWNLSLEQITAMGPQGLRAAHEKNLAVGRSGSGAPPVPEVLRRK